MKWFTTSTALVIAVLSFLAAPVDGVSLLRHSTDAPSAQLIGMLKSMVDNYVKDFDAEADSWSHMKGNMDKLVDAKAGDQAGMMDVMDERAKMEKAHVKKAEGIVSFIKCKMRVKLRV